MVLLLLNWIHLISALILCAQTCLLCFVPQHENPWTIPNFLCVCRIVLAPFLGHLIIQQHFHLSLALFMLAGATDLVRSMFILSWVQSQEKRVFFYLFFSWHSWTVTLPGLGPHRSPLWAALLTHWLIRFSSVFYTSVSLTLSSYQVLDFALKLLLPALFYSVAGPIFS